MAVVSQKLLIVDENLSQTPAYFAGPIQRLASCTDVVVLSPTELVVSHLAGQTLHLLTRTDPDSPFLIADTTITTARGVPNVTDLLSWHPGSRRLAASNCRVPSASIYFVSDNSLEIISEVEVTGEYPGFTHGVEFSPDGASICLVNSGGSNRIRFLDSSTAEEFYGFELEGWRPKDAMYVDPQRLVLPLCDGSPTSQSGERYNSRVALVEVDLESRSHRVLDSADIPHAHIDGVWVTPDGDVFIADQTNDVVKVYQIEGPALTFVRDITGVKLPHGISVLGDLLAVTSYGDASLNLMDRSTTHFEPLDTYTPAVSHRAQTRYQHQVQLYRALEEDREERARELDDAQETIALCGTRIRTLETERSALKDRLVAERAAKQARIERLESERAILRSRLEETKAQSTITVATEIRKRRKAMQSLQSLYVWASEHTPSIKHWGRRRN